MDSSLKNQTETPGVGGFVHEIGEHLLTLKGYVNDINTELETIPSLYVSKTGIITDINALTSGTINNTRLQPHAHNSLTSRDATSCHPIAAITGLSAVASAVSTHTTALSDIKGTVWASFDALFDMYDNMLDAMATELHRHTGFTIPTGWHKR